MPPNPKSDFSLQENTLVLRHEGVFFAWEAVKLAISNNNIDQLAIIERLSELGDKARRSGILSLEKEIPKQSLLYY